MLSMALVPPRDPSKWDEWRQNVYSRQQAEMRRMPAAKQFDATPITIDTILVIMANFTDYTFVSSREDVDSMFNGYDWRKDDAKGSVRQYFYDQSAGQYNPYFRVVGPINLPKGYAYYGEGEDGTARPGEMVLTACDSVKNEVDFSRLDNNDDGYVDLVFVLFAGFGENDPPKVSGLVSSATDLPWPHYSTINTTRTYNGKKISAYEISNELDGYYSTKTEHVVAGIGVLCHEFSHALGLPDLYETRKPYHNQKLLGEWDIMCNGPYNDDMHSPAGYSAYERFYMGWLKPELITEPANLMLEPLTDSNKAFLITETNVDIDNGARPYPNVFYLLENRQLESWDRGLPGNGLMITRINYRSTWWSGNTVNASADNMGVDIIEADGLTPVYNSSNKDNGYFGKPGDLFPEGATEYLGISDHAITDITMTDGVISFKYRGGKQDTPTNIPQADNTANTYKSLENGQLLIHNNGRTYTVFGTLYNE